MATFTKDYLKQFDLDSLELGNASTPPKEIVELALELAGHTKALLGTLSGTVLTPDRDKALSDLSSAIISIKSLVGKV